MRRGFFWRIHAAFERGFEQLAQRLRRRARVEPAASPQPCSSVFALFVGERVRRSCPSSARTSSRRVDAGQFRLHVRAPRRHAPRGDRALFQPRRKTRSARSFPNDEIELVHRQHRPAQPQLSTWPSATARRPAWPTAKSSSRSSTSASQLDARIHGRRCAANLPSSFPDLTFYFQPADIVSQILELRPAGADRHPDRRLASTSENYEIAREIAERHRSRFPARVDVHLHQVVERAQAAHRRGPRRAPAVRADAAGRRESVLVSLLGSGQVSPTTGSIRTTGSRIWSRIPTPQLQDRLDRMRCNSMPLPRNAGLAQSAAARQRRRRSSASATRANVNHYNVQPVFDVYANVQGRDLGSVAGDIDRSLPSYRAEARRRATRSPCAARWKA